jgi:metal-responsive CopG/Arc/MetJ family transcriptional regulator
MTMQTAYAKTSVSLPTDLLEYLKEKSDKLGTPVSRLISQAVKVMRESEPKRRASK